MSNEQNLRINTALLVLAAFLFPQILRGQESSTSSGTLVTIVPTQNGVVIGSDSRGMTKTAKAVLKCDETIKMFPLRKHDRTVIALTGNTQINASNFVSTCAQLKPMVDFAKLVRDHLDSKQGDITREVFESSQNAVLNFFSTFRGSATTTEKDIFLTVVLSHYSIRDRTSIAAYYKLCIKNGQVTKICESDWVVIHQNEPPSVKLYGAADCFTSATAPEWRRKLGKGFLKDYDALMDIPLVESVSHGAALAGVVDIFKTAEKYGELTGCQQDGIGGKTHAYLLDADHVLPFILLPFEKKID